eukprot:tig00021493_g21851.t1
MVFQYLHDKGFTHALAALEEEAGRAYEPDSLHRASALLAALSDAYEAEMLRGPGGLSAAAADDDDLNEIVGAGVYPSEQKACIEGLHTGNILTVRFSPHDLDLVATGGSDRSLRLVNFRGALAGGPTPPPITFPSTDGAILSVDFHPEDPDLLLSCGMDGKARIYRPAPPPQPHEAAPGRRSLRRRGAASGALDRADAGGGDEVRGAGALAPDASFFCIASYDKHLRGGGDGAGYAMVAELAFVGTVEAVEVLPGTHTLVAACRDSNFLEYIDLDAGAVRSKVNMNINGDNVVSFTAMDLAASPNEKYLSVSTDKSRIIVFRTARASKCGTSTGPPTTPSRSRPPRPRPPGHAAGADAGGHGGACVQAHAWHPSGHYVHGTGQDNAIHVWTSAPPAPSPASALPAPCPAPPPPPHAAPAPQLAGHTGVVRDVHFHRARSSSPPAPSTRSAPPPPPAPVAAP